MTAFKTRGGKTEVEPAFLTLLGQPALEIKKLKHSTGRRTALANWITQPDNPLSTRVIVNRVWQSHFGTGIVPTPNDFGTLGSPSHPELLDWLTQQFVQSGWSLKSLHKLILQSAAYQQTARREPSTTIANTDPENRLLWRYPPRRLSAEQARDAMLALSGELKEKSGGPPQTATPPSAASTSRNAATPPDTLMQCFDAPTGFDSAPKRLETNTATQALLMLNADWPYRRASSMASRIRKAHSTFPARIQSAYKLVYSREATDAEVSAASAFIQSATTDKPAPQKVVPNDRFPNETGLRPIAQHFSKVEGFGLGSKTLWLQPGSRFEQLRWNGEKPSSDSFTIEAVAILDVIHKDASVNTLASSWNGNHKSPGWTFGVTSAKSPGTNPVTSSSN